MSRRQGPSTAAPSEPTGSEAPRALGFVGLGQMGARMASRLLDAGYALHVHDVDPDAVAVLVELGARPARDARHVAEQVDVVLLSLPHAPALSEVVLGPHGLLAAERALQVIDTTSANLETTLQVAAAVDAQGGRFLDSPVTGGVEGAERGTLSIMVGGDAQALERLHAIYRVLGTTIVHIGAQGHGQIAKMVNQMLMAAIYCSVAESFAFAEHLGADVERIFEAVEHGGGRSALLSAMRHGITTGEVSRSPNLMMHGKDVDYAVQQSTLSHAFTPMAATISEIWKLARLQGHTDVAARDMFLVWKGIYGSEQRR